MSNLEKKYQKLNKIIQLLTAFIVFSILMIAYSELNKYTLCSTTEVFLCLNKFITIFSKIIIKTIPLLAVLLATYAADRYITHSQLKDEKEFIGVTYRYTAITKDLEDKVIFFTKMIADGGHFLTSVIYITDSIEKRYESLYDKELYKYISIEMVNTINDMSGSIYGLVSSTALAKDILKNSPTSPLPAIKQPETEDLCKDIAKLKNYFYELRKPAKSS